MVCVCLWLSLAWLGLAWLVWLTTNYSLVQNIGLLAFTHNTTKNPQNPAVYFLRVEVVPLLGEPRVFEACKAVAEACIEAGLLRGATDLVRAVVRRKKLLTEDHAKELQVVELF